MTLKHEDGTLSLWARCGKRGQDALVIQGPLCELVRTQRARIFAVTWLAYAAFYLCRKNLSVAIPALEASGVFTRYQLADILFAYSLAYTAGQLFGGSLSDRFSPRRLVTTGMLLSAAATFAMGFSGLYSPFIALAVINGAGQSMGWPGLVKNMASWFDATRRGTVMAWWSTNYVLGGFLATVFATWVIVHPTLLSVWKWQRAFWLPSTLLSAIALIFFAFDRDGPKEEQAQAEQEARQLTASDRRGNYIRLLKRPIVWVVALTAALLKIVRYSFLFWLPLYMTDQLRYRMSDAGYLSSLYELVGFGGALAAGYLSDRAAHGKRLPVACLMQAGLACVCFLYTGMAAAGGWWNALGVALAGIFTYGPDTLMQGAAAQDVGERELAATASGFISGSASVGQLLSPYLVAGLTKAAGWNRLFLIFVFIAMFSASVNAWAWWRGYEGRADAGTTTA